MNVIVKCLHAFTRGKNKGSKCGKKTKNGTNKCFRHTEKLTAIFTFIEDLFKSSLSLEEISKKIKSDNIKKDLLVIISKVILFFYDD